MSGAGAPSLRVQRAEHLRVGVVASSWHPVVMGGLIAGARAVLTDAGILDPLVVRVPGAFELPIVAMELAHQGYDAVVALGVIIRGGTPHFDYVCRATTDGLARVSLDTGVPVGFGVLTCDTEQQALERAGLNDSPEDKGAEAAVAALAMVQTLGDLRTSN